MGTTRCQKMKRALWGGSAVLPAPPPSLRLSCTCVHTRARFHTLTPCFPWFPWQPAVKEQRIQGQVCLQMSVSRIICLLSRYQPISSSNTCSSSLTQTCNFLMHLIVCIKVYEAKHDTWCYLPVAAAVKLEHLQTMLCLYVCSYVFVCVCVREKVCAPRVWTHHIQGQTQTQTCSNMVPD